MLKIINSQELLDTLNRLNWSNIYGNITFNLAGISVIINTTDTVGITLQAWLKQFFINNDIYFSEPQNTQEFPDFFLNPHQPYQHMLEVKAFNYDRTPAFDIANFESYCDSVKEKVFRLDADYLIFGYLMDSSGNITIKKIWLKKIWEIAGDSARYPLKTQIKRNMIYNIRPNTAFKSEQKVPFNSKDEFLFAIYQTLISYKGKSFADEWKNTLSINYSRYYGTNLSF